MKKTAILMVILNGLAQHAAAEKTLTLTQVIYQESSPGVGSYPYRILVNDDYLRFDGGKDDDGYILFSREFKQVVSVNHEDQSRFYIKPEANKPYENNKIEVKIVDTELKKAPKINNISAKMHEIVANENLCRQVVSFEGLLPNVTQAWKEYEEVMQAQNQLSLSRTPEDMQTDCFITNNITHASQFLNYGLPFSIKSKDGTIRILQSYSEVEKPATFISVPAEYREFAL